MRIGRRYRAALAMALGTTLALMPLHYAVADATPTQPSITVNPANVDFDINGPGADFSVTVQNPPTTDAFIRLYIYSSTGDLHFTDSSGNELPVQSDAGSRYVDIGMADADGNGVPGVPLTAGAVPLHVSCGYPALSYRTFVAALVDGATGSVITHTGFSTAASLIVNTPHFSGIYPPLTVTIGATAPADDPIQIQMAMDSPPATTTTDLTFSAQQIAAAGYTAQQLAAHLHAGTHEYLTAPTPLSWAIGSDGSLTVSLPTDHWDTAHPSTPATTCP